VYKTLKYLGKNQVATVLDVSTGHPLSERLVELGFVAGEAIEIVHEAPLSRDPIVVVCAGTRIALRRDEADLILVDVDFERKGTGQ
jgi:ferrous iron transport protein A